VAWSLTFFFLKKKVVCVSGSWFLFVGASDLVVEFHSTSVAGMPLYISLFLFLFWVIVANRAMR
jgi:hypothetical protein